MNLIILLILIIFFIPRNKTKKKKKNENGVQKIWRRRLVYRSTIRLLSNASYYSRSPSILWRPTAVFAYARVCACARARPSLFLFMCVMRASGYCQFAGAIPSNMMARDGPRRWWKVALFNFTPNSISRRKHARTHNTMHDRIHIQSVEFWLFFLFFYDDGVDSITKTDGGGHIYLYETFADINIIVLQCVLINFRLEYTYYIILYLKWQRF